MAESLGHCNYSEICENTVQTALVFVANPSRFVACRSSARGRHRRFTLELLNLRNVLRSAVVEDTGSATLFVWAQVACWHDDDLAHANFGLYTAAVLLIVIRARALASTVLAGTGWRNASRQLHNYYNTKVG